jgi:hypothetical protein
MHLSEALRLVRKIEPEASMHRDHICSESVTHDLAHCPKMLSQIYAWRVESNIWRNRSVERKSYAEPCGTRGAISLSGAFETARPPINFTGTRE